MKKLLKLAVLVAFLATSVGTTLPSSASAATASACDATAVGTRNTANGDHSIFTTKGSKVSASYKLTGPAGCKLTMQLISWQAPNPTDGRPYSAQKEIDRVTKTAGPGTYTLTATLPDCYYQIDLVFKGNQDYSVRNIGYLHGGAQKCGTKPQQPVTPTTAPPAPHTTVMTQTQVTQVQTTPPPTTTVTPPTPTVAATPTATVQATELPHTGPEAAIGTFFATTGAGTLVHRYVSRKSRR